MPYQFHNKLFKSRQFMNTSLPARTSSIQWYRRWLWISKINLVSKQTTDYKLSRLQKHKPHFTLRFLPFECMWCQCGCMSACVCVYMCMWTFVLACVCVHVHVDICVGIRVFKSNLGSLIWHMVAADLGGLGLALRAQVFQVGLPLLPCHVYTSLNSWC